MKRKIIFITGSTGLLGQALLSDLRNQDFKLILGKRHPDLSKKDPEEAYFNLQDQESVANLPKVDIVVHLASETSKEKLDSNLIGIRTIVELVQKFKIGHLIFISIVGVKEVPLKYFKLKAMAEDVIKKSGIQYSILRSTQFIPFFENELAKHLARPFAIVPNLQYQPIETKCVSQELTSLCVNGPSNSIKEIGGSQKIFLYDALRKHKKTLNRKTVIVPIPHFLLGAIGKALTTENKNEHSKPWDIFYREKYGDS